MLCLSAAVCACTGLWGTTIRASAVASIYVETGSVFGATVSSLLSSTWTGAWDQGVCWTDRQTTIRIDFPTSLELSVIFIQGHEDDAFQLDYLSQDVWHPLWLVQQTAASNFRALSNVAQTIRSEVFAGLYIDAIRITASQTLAWEAAERFGLANIQVYGNTYGGAVPEPSATWLALCGLWLGGMRLSLRRRKS
jgi:hypothetical protein